MTPGNKDGGGVDGGPDASSTKPTCLPFPSGASASNPIVAGTNLQIWGVTDDNTVIYTDEAAGTLYAIPAAGGTPKTVMTGIVGSHNIQVSHDVVFAWTGLDNVGAGALSVWTTTAPTATMLASKSADIATGPSDYAHYAASDSSYVVFIDNFDDNMTEMGDLYIATPTGQNRTKLLGGVNFVGIGSDVVQIAFAGSGYVVVTHTEVSGQQVYVSEFAVPSGQRTDFLSTANLSSAPSFFSMDPSETVVLVSGSSGLELFHIGANPAGTMIDPHGSTGGFFAPNGTDFFFITTDPFSGATALKGASIASPSSTSTLNSRFAGIYAVSPNGAFVLGYDGMTNGLTDVSLASTAPPSTETAANAQFTTPYGEATFTTDSSHVVYTDTASTQSSLYSFSTSGGGSPVPLNNVSGYVTPLGKSSSVVLTQGNWSGTGNSETADLSTIDTATGGPPAAVAKQADVAWALTCARDHVIYSLSNVPAPMAGIYVASVP